MSLSVFPPGAALKPYIGSFWDYEDLTGVKGARLSILPDTATYLCFIYQNSLQTTHKNTTYTTQSGVAGFQIFRSDLGCSGVLSGVSARLRPGGLSFFRRGIALECADRRIDCRYIFPQQVVSEIEERLPQFSTAAERVEFVKKFLLTMVRDEALDPLVDAARRIIRTSYGQCRISGVSAKLDVSKRTLERRFRNHVGVSPKVYARVLRLRNAVTQHSLVSRWSEIAAQAGFFDQSHMINEFREFYGASPGELAAQIAASPTFRFSGLLDLQPPTIRAA